MEIFLLRMTAASCLASNLTYDWGWMMLQRRMQYLSTLFNLAWDSLPSAAFLVSLSLARISSRIYETVPISSCEMLFIELACE